MKLATEEMHKMGAAEIKITKEEAQSFGEYISKTGEADLLDKDNKAFDTVK